MTLRAIHLAALAAFTAALLTSGCSSEGVERRQHRIDQRTAARQERWRIRAEHEDARAAARFNSW